MKKFFCSLLAFMATLPILADYPTITIDGVVYVYEYIEEYDLISGKPATSTYSIHSWVSVQNGSAAEGEVEILPSISIDGHSISVSSIDAGAFRDNTKITKVSIPGKVHINDWAFGGCTSLREVVIESRETVIGDNVFRGCTNLKKVSLPSALSNMGGYTFYDCTSLTSISIPEGIDKVNNECFRGCTKLENVTFQGAVKRICSGVFYGCTSLKTIDLSKGVEVIEGEAFQNCSALTTIIFPLSGLTTIGERCFYKCTGLESINFPASVTNIEANVCSGCTGLVEAVIQNGKLDAGSIEIASMGLFSGCTNLTKATINWAGKLPNSCFNDCSSLETVVLNGVTAIGYQAFQGCTSLESITLPNTVKKIGGEAFKDLTSLETVNLPNSLISIEASAFNGCTSLASITIPSGVSELGNAAFERCTSLENVSMPSSLTKIGISTFEGCTKLEQLTLPTNLVVIDDGAFKGCTSLRSLDLPSTLQYVFREVFYNCTSLHSLTFLAAMKQLGDYAFDGCTNMELIDLRLCTNLNITSTERTGVFRGVPESTVILLPGSTPPTDTKEPYAVLSEDNTTLTFYYDDQKERREGIDISPNIINWFDSRYTIKCVIFDSSFANCTSITSTARWFDQCKALTTIEGIQNLKTENVTDMSQMFWGCSSLTALDVSGFNTTNVTDMSDMFTYCMSLATLDLSGFSTEKVTDISSILEGCSTLTSLSLGFDINQTSENSNAFSGIGSEEKSCILIVPNDLRACYETALTKGNGQLLGGFFSMEDDETHKEPYAVLSEDNITLTFYYDENKEAKGGMDVGPFTYDFSCGVNSGWYEKSGKIKTVIFDDSFVDCTSITSTAFWFCECTNLTTITGIEKLNTANVTDMTGMFGHCFNLTSLDLRNFNTEKVNFMIDMFSGCSGLTSLDVSNFNTTNVLMMNNMFVDCYRLTTIYSNDEWNCNSSDGMFSECTSLKGAISYDSEKTDATYANPMTGYFTARGDADGNGIVDDNDVIKLGIVITTKEIDDLDDPTLDMNGDGVVNVADIVKMINIIKAREKK